MSRKLTKEELAECLRVTVDEFDGIIPYYEAFYIHSIHYAADRASLAFERYKVAVADRDDPAMIVALVQEALTHAAALSRFFWPSPRKGDQLAPARGKKLRQAFGLEDSSPLSSREVRNAIEHFDERLDSFLLPERFGYFFPTPRIGSHGLADEITGNIFKLVDPESEIFVLLGEKYEFGPIRKAVFDIYAKAVEMTGDGERLRPRPNL